MIMEENIKDASKGPKFPAKNGDFWVFQIYSKQEILLSKFLDEKKMPQRRDNAGAVCDSDMGMLHQKMG